MDTSVSFGAVNYAVLAIYLVGMMWIGIATAGKQKSTRDFFLAGRNVPWIAVAMSVFATITSAISYMGTPGLVYAENVTTYVGPLMMPIVAPVIIVLFLPFYQRLQVTTSYEYIYRRFGPRARYAVSLLFLGARLGWLGTVIFAPSLGLAVVTGIPIWLSILAMGALSVIYTTMGGMTAVIWTDVAQFLILVGGAIVVAGALIWQVPGGLPGIVRVASEGGRLNLHEFWPSLTHMTVTAVALSYFLQFMHDYGVDQITVQRLLAAKDFRGMVRATLMNALFTVLIMGTLAFIGLGLFAYYSTGQGALPKGLSADRIFPYYVVHVLPTGVSGLVIAAVFAAAMSSVSSGINSVVTVIVNDFVVPLRKTARTDHEDVQLARTLTAVIGVFAIGIAFFASTIGEIMKASQTFLGLFSGPVLALFLLGMLTRRASFAGWLVGAVTALTSTVWVQRNTDVHFVYYFPMSFAIAFVVGLAIGAVFPSKHAAEGLTVWGPRPD